MPFTSLTYLSINLRSSLTRPTFLTRSLLLVLFAFVAGHFNITPGQSWNPNIQFNKKSVDLGDRGNLRINPSTLALEMEIPLGSYSGRAGMGVPVTVSYSSKAWRVDYHNYDPGPFSSNGTPIGNGYTRVVAKFAEHSAAGWTSSIGFPVLDTTLLSEYYDGSGNPKSSGGCVGSPNATGTAALCYIVDRILVRMPDGSTHELRSSDQPFQPLGQPEAADFYAVDGSRMRYNRPSQTLFMADGSRYRFTTGEYLDRNGNKLIYTGTGWTDTLGRAIGAPPLANNVAPGSYPYSLPGVSGQYIFVWKNLGDPGVLTTAQPLKYVADSGCAPGNGSFSPRLFQSDIPSQTCITNASSVFNPVVLYQIQLPTGRSYTFTYNEYGEIDRVELPTGGYERYEHAQTPPLSTPKLPYSQANRGVIHRYVSTGAGAGEAAWHYSPTTGKVGITAPDNTLTERFMHTEFSGLCAWGYCPETARAGMTYEERAYSAPEGGVRRLLRRTLTEWSVTGSNGSMAQDATRNPRVMKSVELLLDTGGDALAKTTEYGYDLSNQFTTGPNQTSVSEYDFVPVAQSTAQTAAIGSIPRAAQPLRTTETAYLDDNPAYRAQNILGLPTLVTVKNGAGVVTAKTAMGYDELAYQLVNNYGAVTGWSAPAGLRANLTTVRRYLDVNSPVALGQSCPAGVCVDMHAQYDQCGSPVKSVDALGNETLTAYSPDYDYAYPTSVTTPAPNPSAVPNPSGGPAFAPGTFGSTTGFTSFTAYDHDTGRVTSTTDANGKTTTFDYNDPLGRLKRVDRPDGGRTTYAYTDQHQCGAYVETRTLLDTGGRELASWQFFDGLGRPYLTETYENQETPNIFVRVDTRYDALGRVSQVSNPYRTSACTAQANPSGRWTETAYDALGRVSSVTTPDGAKVYTLYDGARTLTTDQAGKQRIGKADALGRLTDVWEVRSPDSATGTEAVSFPVPPNLASVIPTLSAGYKTVYAYDVLGNLRTVAQGAQPARTFGYDSLSRLTSAANPESGTVGYTYDANGNLETKTDARGVTTTYRYDRLNRNIITSYAGGGTSTPTVRRYYDNPDSNSNGLGRPYWTEAVGVSSTAFNAYDPMGRLTRHRQVYMVGGAWGQYFDVKRTYDKAGNVLTQTYPSGHTVTYNYDAAGRPGDNGAQQAFTGTLGDGMPRTYASALSYSEFGGIQQERFGTQTPLYHKLHYNVRGQLYDIRLSTVPWVTDQWEWNRGAVVNYFTPDCQWQASAATNNGNLLCSEHAVPLDPNAGYGSGGAGAFATSFQNYTYDALNRLMSVSEKKYATGGSITPVFTQTYTYDRWGNRTVNLGQSPNVPVAQFDFDRGNLQATNRLYAPGDTAIQDVNQRRMRYDAAGNLVHDSYTGKGARTYDAENRMTGAVADVYGNWAFYTYDADGRRVKRKVANEEWWQVYGIGGELLAEYRAGAPTYVPSKEYGYRGGELLVTMASGDDQRLRRFVYNLYYGAQQRDPSAQELQDRTNELAAAGAQGKPQLLQKAKEIARALFIQTTYETSPARTDAQYVSDLYYTYLHRAPDTSGLNYWAGAAAGGATNRSNVCDAFQESPEFSALVSTIYGDEASEGERRDRLIHAFHLGAYGRFANATELDTWRAQLDAAAALGADNVKATAETLGRGLFAAQVSDLTLPAGQFVTNLYEGFLQRGPDAGGLSFWTAQAGSTAQARQNVLNAFAGCDPFRELAGALYRETFWLVSDHLGTPRMVADRTGSLAGIKRHDYLPFGEELYAGAGGRTAAQGYTATDNIRQKFTRKERDSETGLDYSIARYYSPVQGRFISPDEPLADQSPRDPSSWNLYTYVRNNPLRATDPDGRAAIPQDWWEKFSNQRRGFGWRTNEEVKKEVERRRQELRRRQEEMGGCLAFRWQEGGHVSEWMIIDPEEPNSAVLWLNYEFVELALSGHFGPLKEVKPDNVTPDLPMPNMAMGGGTDKYRKPKSNLSGKEGSKDIPSWAKGERPLVGENGDKFARRLLDRQYGQGNYSTKSQTEYSKLQKFADRNFEP